LRSINACGLGNRPRRRVPVGCFATLFYEPKRYDLAGVGRYKINKKLRLIERLGGRRTSTENIVDPETGELIVERGQKITRRQAEQVHARRASMPSSWLPLGTASQSSALFSNDQPEENVTVITPARYLSRHQLHGGPFLVPISAQWTTLTTWAIAV
jgi:hypothetical protein